MCGVDLAREAGLDIERFPRVRIDVSGGTARARRCPVDLTVFGRRIGTEILIVDKSEIVLLGRRDVFAAFQFGFDERARTLLIEPYE
jgi:hypothetical protein